MSSALETPVIFTPDNEPYLGRETVYALDKVIGVCLAQNAAVAPHTHTIETTAMQQAACQLIPQGVSIGLSIRELVRQGYLFGAFTLVRPLTERAVILLYLQKNPHEIAKWQRGWQVNEAPSLVKMLENIEDGRFPGAGQAIVRPLNSILHGKPDSAIWSLIPIGDDAVGHGVSKSLNNPTLCDDICTQTAAWLTVLTCMMNAFFPLEK